ncbi:MAG TPA: hypothetical protein VHB51_01810 [Candidatus Saccharimonadales bacterium]|nr:hypothetical protein [Candidatus Saccharimonadales bacterium]
MLLAGSVPQLVNFGKKFVAAHNTEPFDVIVGDDVSGRIPTLLTHYVLKMAAAAGYCDTVPPVYFMASGQQRAVGKFTREIWQENLDKAAKKIIIASNAKIVALITEYIATEETIKNLKDTFEKIPGVYTHKYVLNEPYIYLGGPPSEPAHKQAARAVVGVEKIRPMPFSYRHPDFNGRHTAEFRNFLGDVAATVFENMYDEPAPHEGLLIPRSGQSFYVPGQPGRLQRMARHCVVPRNMCPTANH